MNARERIVSPDKKIKHELEFWEYKRTILYERLKLYSKKSIDKREQTSSLLALLEHQTQLAIKQILMSHLS